MAFRLNVTRPRERKREKCSWNLNARGGAATAPVETMWGVGHQPSRARQRVRASIATRSSSVSRVQFISREAIVQNVHCISLSHSYRIYSWTYSYLTCNTLAHNCMTYSYITFSWKMRLLMISYINWKISWTFLNFFFN